MSQINLTEIFNELFSNLALAAPEAAAEGPGIESLFIQLVIIFVIFYFILIRPQQKKHKAQAEMNKQLKKGDSIVTASGVMGLVKKANDKDNFVELEIAENTVIKILRSSINEKLDSKAKLVKAEEPNEKPKKKPTKKKLADKKEAKKPTEKKEEK